ncbi:YraN family protein [Arcanobacterium hippocoleae]|uniref:YraN family protein n=1 Tax=Arcanobacterium hippocoleae TaxID=149017 RepID=UPI0033404C59
MELTTKERTEIAAYTNRELGAWGEDLAVQMLATKGFSILARNWRCRYGEIDIVAFDPQDRAVIAMEVKTRRTVQSGLPEEAITVQKLQRLRILIVAWISAHREECRHLFGMNCKYR